MTYDEVIFWAEENEIDAKTPQGLERLKTALEEHQIEMLEEVVLYFGKPASTGPTKKVHIKAKRTIWKISKNIPLNCAKGTARLVIKATMAIPNIAKHALKVAGLSARAIKNVLGVVKCAPMVIKRVFLALKKRFPKLTKALIIILLATLVPLAIKEAYRFLNRDGTIDRLLYRQMDKLPTYQPPSWLGRALPKNPYKRRHGSTQKTKYVPAIPKLELPPLETYYGVVLPLILASFCIVVLWFLVWQPPPPQPLPPPPPFSQDFEPFLCTFKNNIILKTGRYGVTFQPTAPVLVRIKRKKSKPLPPPPPPKQYVCCFGGGAIQKRPEK